MRVLLLSALTLLLASSVHAQDARDVQDMAALVGHWALTSVSTNDRTMDLPPGTSMTWSFEQDGTATVRTGDGHISGSGTYTVEGSGLRMTMEGEPKTLAFAVEPDHLVVHFDFWRQMDFDRVAAAPVARLPSDG